MATVEDIVTKLDTLNNTMQISSTGWNPDGFIKVFDHIFNKLGDVLPEPTFAAASKKIALKVAGGTSGAILLIGIIVTIFLLVKYGTPTKSTQTVQEYDSDGNVTTESSGKIKYSDKDGCKKDYVNGKVSKKTCIINKSNNAWLIVLIISIVISIFVFVSLLGPVRKWHYAKALRFSNPYHKSFIDYAHRLFTPEDL